MTIQIYNHRISGTAWGNVDKDELRQRLQALLEAEGETVHEAIRECYAVLRGATIDDAPSANWWGPHHELRQDNTLVLNRGGMIAAAGALAGARAEPELTEAQRRDAARHILGHYRQEDVNLQPPTVLLELAGEMGCLEGLVGEMRPADIPLAPGVDLAALKAGDPDPMEVVVEIPAGVSKRGWHYGAVVIRHLAEQVAKRTVAGFLGHQKAEDVDSQFPIPVTHWVGAIYKERSALLRGVVDKTAPDLKRWIRAGRINQVSLYGILTTEQRGDETHVTNIDLLSVDWTPLARAGMQTRVVALGESSDIGGNMGSDVDGVVLTAQPLGLSEVMGELRRLKAQPQQVLGEMGWKPEDVYPQDWPALQESAAALGELATALGLAAETKPAEVVTAGKAAAEAQRTLREREAALVLEKVLGEMVPNERVRPLIRRMLPATPQDEAGLRKVVGELLAAEDVKGLLAVAVFSPRSDNRGQTDSAAIRRVAI